MSGVVRVRAWWDTTDPACAGWYAMTYGADGCEIDDSMKVGFPIDLDRYTEDQAREVRDDLRDAFPGCAIEVR